MIRRILFLLVILSYTLANFPSAIGKNGAVSSSSSHATQAGIDVLKNGGNAIDAAVAVGFALSVTFPNAGNLGGGWFMVKGEKQQLTKTCIKLKIKKRFT